MSGSGNYSGGEQNNVIVALIMLNINVLILKVGTLDTLTKKEKP
jgi:hypothetical protein